MHNDVGNNESPVNNSFFSSFPPSYNPPFFTPNHFNHYNQNNNKCHNCDKLKKDMSYMSNQLTLMNKNIELLNDQIKLLDMKLSISMQNKSDTEGHNKSNSNANTKSKHTTNSFYNKKNVPPKNRPYKKYDVPSQHQNSPQQFPPLIPIEPSMIIHIDDIIDKSNLGDIEQINPFNIIKKIFPFMDAGEKKNVENTENVDSEEEEEVSEHNSEEEFEELDYEINSLNDLIDLGKLYDKVKLDKDKENEQEKEKNNDKENSNEKNLKTNHIFEKISNHNNPEKVRVIKGLLMRDGSIKFLNKDNILERDKEKEKENNKGNEQENNKKEDIQSNKSYVIDGKKFNINLEILNKLVKPLTKLKQMIGLETVKNSIVDMILYYLQNFEKKNNNMLHTVIEGPPGVGKTQLGKILAEIYAGLGVIPSSKFKLVKRSDLIGQYVGHTAPQTQKLIDEADGGVLFIDEAYSLGNEEKRDSFSKECIDTLNQNLSENKRKFICIIAGYPDELDKCFFAYNPGLKRRFPFKFRIDGYKADELKDIFVKKVGDIHWRLDTDLNDKKYILNFFNKHMSDFKYFGGDVNNFLLHCKFAHSRRVFGKHPKNKRKINQIDMDIGFDRFIKHKKTSDTEIPAHLQHVYT